MSQELDLIKALAKAAGYHIETVVDYAERVEESMIMRPGHIIGRDSNRELLSEGQVWKRDDRGNYFSVLKKPLISFTVTPLIKEKVDES